MKRREMLTARDVMTTRLSTLHPDTTIADAIRLLLKKDVSGAPVVNEAGELVGILSERDCLRVLALGDYDAEDHDRARSVSEFMTEVRYTVEPGVGIFSLADFFLTHPMRRLPVIEGVTLVGLVSRRDVLRGIQKMIRRRQLPPADRQRRPKLYPSATDTSPGVIAHRLK